MDEKMKIIFLDFDGVINGSDPMRYILWQILTKLHLKSLYNKIYKDDVYGIHESKIKRLSKICDCTGAYVVLTSSWRDRAFDVIFNDKEASSPDLEKLKILFKKYDIEVIDKTRHSLNNERQDEIVDWLARYENRINKYIILDDEYNHLNALKDKLILTSNSGKGYSKWYNKEELRNTHVMQAIEMLGGTI